VRLFHLLAAPLVAAMLMVGCSHEPARPHQEACWMAASAQWTHATLPALQNGVASVIQRATIAIPRGSVVIQGSGVHWQGPETLEPTFFEAGADADGVIVAEYPIYDYRRNYGNWMAYVVLGLQCREKVFVDSLPFEVEEERGASTPCNRRAGQESGRAPQRTPLRIPAHPER